MAFDYPVEQQQSRINEVDGRGDAKRADLFLRDTQERLSPIPNNPAADRTGSSGIIDFGTNCPLTQLSGARAVSECAAQPPGADEASDRTVARANPRTDGADRLTRSGTLVLEQSERWQSFKVNDGMIESDGKVVGKLTDSGQVTFNGRTFKLNENGEHGAFLGLGSDGQALHLTDKNSQESGFNGKFTSADGRKQLTVVANDIYDSDAKFVGRLGSDGSVQLPQCGVSAINALRDGWSFQGTEGGKPRAFQTSSDLANGSMFMSEAAGGEQRKYSVRMGMLIDDVTGDQKGMVIPPTVRRDKSLEGGSVILHGDDGVTVRPFSTLHHAVFKLNRIGNSRGEHIEDQFLQGVTLGGGQMADGQDHPTRGIFSITQALSVEHKRDALAASNKEMIEQQFRIQTQSVEDSSVYEHIANQRKIDDQTEDMRSRFAHQNMDTLSAFVATGKVTDQDLQHIRQRNEVSKTELCANPLEYSRRQLDNWQHKTEPLPSDPELINGTVKVPIGQGKVETWTIRNGEFKTPRGTVGRIENADGAVTLTVDNAERQSSMPSMVGTVWHLEYQSDDGKPVVQDMISLGNRMVGGKDIRERAYAEHLYAYEANAVAGDSAISRQEYAGAASRRAECESRLDAILRNGVTSKKDIEFLADAGAEVRPEGLRNPVADKRDVIGLPPLKDEAVNHTNGLLRIGNDVYIIQAGNLTNINDVNDPISGGRLLPNYQVELPGRGVLSLADQNRVLLQFQIEGSDQTHRVIGTGAPCLGRDGYRAGGLVNADELMRQAKQDLEQARKGNAEYFEHRPYVTGGFASWAMGGRDEALKEFSRDLGKNVSYLNKEIGQIFKEGFDTNRCSNTRLDPFIQQTDATMAYIGKQSVSTQGLAAEGMELQRRINEGVYIAATTIATAGAGAVFNALSQTAKIVEMGRMGNAIMFVAETATSATTSGALSAGLRSSDHSDALSNFGAGALQGGVGGMGSAGGRLLNANSTISVAQQLADKAKTGAALTRQEQVVLDSLIGRLVSGGNANMGRVVNETFETGSAALHSVAYGKADQIRNHTANAATPEQLALGLIVSRLGHFAGQPLRNATKSDLINNVSSGTVSSYFTGALQEIPHALDADNHRIAARLGVPEQWLSSSVLSASRNLDALLNDLNSAGLTSASSTPFLAASSSLLRSGLRAYQNRRTTSDKVEPPSHVEPEQRAGIDAIAQSNNYSQRHQLSGPVEDGFRQAGAATTFAPDGSFNKGWRAATLVDRQNDEQLRHAIEFAKTQFGKLPQRERAEAVARYAHELLNGDQGVSARTNNDAATERWSAQFGQDHGGESIPLGEYIRQRRGVCAEQSLLTKVLADEVGLKATLVRGDKNDGNELNHSWVNFEFTDRSKATSDPRNGLYLFEPQLGYRPGSTMENPVTTAYEGSGTQGLGSRVRTAGTDRTQVSSISAESWHGTKYKLLDRDGDLVTRNGQPLYRNEDASWVSGDRNTCVVFDGMGGQGGGEAAAQIARRSVQQSWQRFPKDGTADEKAAWMRTALLDAHGKIVEEQARALAGEKANEPAAIGKRPDGTEIYSGSTMAATAVMTARHDQELLIAWAGDSRAYRLRDGKLEQLTEDDHPPGAKKNIVNNGIGLPRDPKINQKTIDIKPGDRIIIASDGLETLSQTEIQKTLSAKPGANAEESNAALMAAVKAKGKKYQDNVTAVVFDIDAPKPPQPAAQPHEPQSSPRRVFRVSEVVDLWRQGKVDGCANLNGAIAKLPPEGQLNTINRAATKLESTPELRSQFLLSVVTNAKLPEQAQREALNLLAVTPPKDNAGISQLQKLSLSHANQAVRDLAANAVDPAYRGGDPMIIAIRRSYDLQGRASMLEDPNERAKLLEVAKQIRDNGGR